MQIESPIVSNSFSWRAGQNDSVGQASTYRSHEQHDGHHVCEHLWSPARDHLHDAGRRNPPIARHHPPATHQPVPARNLYKYSSAEPYTKSMDVAVSELRAHLSDYLDRAREGDEIVITDRGIPIARLLGLTATATLERLAADGVIARATAAPRPRAAGQPRPRPRRPVADQVSDQRR
jgi:prevent-host-death family protein